MAATVVFGAKLADCHRLDSLVLDYTVLSCIYDEGFDAAPFMNWAVAAARLLEYLP